MSRGKLNNRLLSKIIAVIISGSKYLIPRFITPEMSVIRLVTEWHFKPQKGITRVSQPFLYEIEAIKFHDSSSACQENLHLNVSTQGWTSALWRLSYICIVKQTKKEL